VNRASHSSGHQDKRSFHSEASHATVAFVPGILLHCILFVCRGLNSIFQVLVYPLVYPAVVQVSRFRPARITVKMERDGSTVCYGCYPLNRLVKVGSLEA
jgi:hypothetical protein